MPGSVRVSVLEVADLPLALVGRTVQVRVTMGMKEYKTKPVRAHGGKTPPWNADFAFPVLNLRDKLVVLIVGNRGETMTKAEIEVSTIVQKGYRDEFVPLQGGGRIHLKLSFVLSEEERRRIEAMRVTKKQPPESEPEPERPEPALEKPAPPVSLPAPPPVTLPLPLPLPLVPPPPPSLTITEIVDEEDKENEGRGARPGRRIPKGLARREQGRDDGVAEAAGKVAVAAAAAAVEGSAENEEASGKVEMEAGEKNEEEGKAQEDEDDDARMTDGEVAAPATPPQQEAGVPEREPEGVGAADGARAGEEERDVNGAEDAAEVENFLEKEMGESWMDEWIRDKPGEEEVEREVVSAELGAGGKAEEAGKVGLEVEVNAGADVARESVGAGKSVEEQGRRLEEEKQAVAYASAQEARDGLEESDGDDDSVSFEDQIDAVQRRWLMYADSLAVQQGEVQAKDVGVQDQDQVKAADEGKGKAGAVQEHVQEVDEEREEADEGPEVQGTNEAGREEGHDVSEVRGTNEAGREGGDKVPEVRETKDERREEAGEVPEFRGTKEGRREEADEVPEFRETKEARVGEADQTSAFPEIYEAKVDAPELRETNQARIEEAAVVPQFQESKEARAGGAEDAPEFRESTQARTEEAAVVPEFPGSKEAGAAEAEDAPEFRETNQSRVEEAEDDASKLPGRKEASIGGADDAPEFRETSQARVEEADDALESQETNQAQQVGEIPVQIVAHGAAGNEEQEAVEEADSVPVPVRSHEGEEGEKGSYHDGATTVDKRMVEDTPTVTRVTVQDELPPVTAKSAPAPAAESGKQQKQEEQTSKPASTKGKGEARHPSVGGIIAHFLGGFAIVAGAAAVLWSVGSRKYHVVADGETFHTFAPPNSSSLQNSAFCKLNPGVCESSKVYSGQRLRLA